MSAGADSDGDQGPPTTTLAAGGDRGAPAGVPVRQVLLSVTEGPDAGATWRSTDASCAIGSHPGCQLVIDDPTVSRFHCEILIDGGAPRVRDTSSRNGTLVDGVRVVEAFLRDGSVLRLGHTTIRVGLAPDRGRLPVSSRDRFGVLVGASLAMRRTFALLERAAASDATVLLEGETGTGKTQTARSIHLESGRRAGPFLIVDCAAIPGTLLESELFGHVRGAFTGADAGRAGAFEEADHGTLLLDEIGELPSELQPKLLGVLENRELRRLGSTSVRPVDVRIVAATNRDLRAEVNAGRFRADLYFRLAVIRIVQPPLRERAEDIPLLADAVLRSLGAGDAQVAALLTDELRGAIARAPWPGNIRELRNYLERCLVFEDALPLGDEVGDREQPPVDSLGYTEARARVLRDFERAYLRRLLERHDGKVAAAAEAAGVDRTYFYRLLRRHRLGGPGGGSA